MMLCSCVIIETQRTYFVPHKCQVCIFALFANILTETKINLRMRIYCTLRMHNVSLFYSYFIRFPNAYCVISHAYRLLMVYIKQNARCWELDAEVINRNK